MKKFYILGALALMVLSSPMAVSALQGYQKYSNYTLYNNCYNNATASHNKETSDQHISNKVTRFENTNKATFWAATGASERISKTYSQEIKTTAKINLTTKRNKGASVRMGMENYNLVTYSGKVDGSVDFR